MGKRIYSKGERQRLNKKNIFVKFIISIEDKELNSIK